MFSEMALMFASSPLWGGSQGYRLMQSQAGGRRVDGIVRVRARDGCAVASGSGVGLCNFRGLSGWGRLVSNTG